MHFKEVWPLPASLSCPYVPTLLLPLAVPALGQALALWRLRPCSVPGILLSLNFDALSLDVWPPPAPPAPCSLSSQGLPCKQPHLVQPVPAPELSWGTGSSSTQQTGKQGALGCWPALPEPCR